MSHPAAVKEPRMEPSAILSSSCSIARSRGGCRDPETSCRRALSAARVAGRAADESIGQRADEALDDGNRAEGRRTTPSTPTLPPSGGGISETTAPWSSCLDWSLMAPAMAPLAWETLNRSR